MSTADPKTRDTIIRLLGSLGSRKEVDAYLRRFSSVDSSQFAVVKVTGEVLQGDLDALASALAFLDRVGLCPVVVHGAGPQVDEALDAAGIETHRRDGLRVTSPEALAVVRQVMQRENLRLVNAIEAHGAQARPITTGVFQARRVDPDAYGLVGEVTEVSLEVLRDCVKTGHLPILTCLGETEDGQILNIHADVAARELALAVKPYKIIFLTADEGLLDGDGERILSVNLAEDYDVLMGKPWMQDDLRRQLTQIHALLHQLPLSSSVSITRPELLARELFTHTGAGTLVRRGESVGCLEDLDDVDRGRLQDLIEACFGGQLAADYFDRRPIHRLYVTEAWRAVAVVTLENGVPYLDKFGVLPEAQGEGIGRSVWWRLLRENPEIFWRARADNPINSFYFAEADGAMRTGPWVVFWRGLGGDLATIGACVDHAAALPATMVHPQEIPS